MPLSFLTYKYLHSLVTTCLARLDYSAQSQQPPLLAFVTVNFLSDVMSCIIVESAEPSTLASGDEHCPVTRAAGS